MCLSSFSTGNASFPPNLCDTKEWFAPESNSILAGSPFKGKAPEVMSVASFAASSVILEGSFLRLWWNVGLFCLYLLQEIPCNVPFLTALVAHPFSGGELLGVMPRLPTLVVGHFLSTFPLVLLFALLAPLRFASSSSKFP